MTSQFGRHLIFSISMLSLIVAAAPRAMAQTKLPESAFTPSPESATISRQLRLAQQLGRKALAGLEATSPSDSTPIDPGVVQAARETYGLIRSARHGMELSRAGKKFSDPIFDLNFKKVSQAWDLSRIPVDKLSWGVNRQEYLAQAVPALRQALRLVDQVLIVMP
jgi:hypothetical protein